MLEYIVRVKCDGEDCNASVEFAGEVCPVSSDQVYDDLADENWMQVGRYDQWYCPVCVDGLRL